MMTSESGGHTRADAGSTGSARMDAAGCRRSIDTMNRELPWMRLGLFMLAKNDDELRQAIRNDPGKMIEIAGCMPGYRERLRAWAEAMQDGALRVAYLAGEMEKAGEIETTDEMVKPLEAVFDMLRDEKGEAH